MAKGHMMSEAEREKRMATMPGSGGPTGKQHGEMMGKQARKGKRQTPRSQAVRQGYRG